MSGSRFLRGSSRGSSAESLSDVDEKEKAHMVMREQFKLFDEKEEGFDKEMMKAVLLKGDDAMPLDEAEEVVNEFFQEFDLDKEGLIRFDGFCKGWMKLKDMLPSK